MRESANGSEKALIITFLVIVFSVPVAQIGLDLYRGQRVQFTDLFRYPPTETNLRQYEQNLEDRSWAEAVTRPVLQRLLFNLAGEAGAKVVVGADGWLFYRTDVDYLVQADTLDVDTGSRWVTPAEGNHMDSVAKAICRFDNQLRERGIKLLVVAVPGKPSVYPDRLSGQAVAGFRSRTLDLLDRLEARGVATVDLFTLFERVRRESGGNTSYYLRTDTHWTPLGAKIAAQATADKLRRLGFRPGERREFETRRIRVGRRGDLVEMVAASTGPPRGSEAEFDCEQVFDPAFGLMTSTAADRPGSYRYPGEPASILALGDSFCRIYQGREPASLGEVIGGTDTPPGSREGSTRLVPGSAGFLSHLALALGTPVDYIVSDGGASTEVRRSLSAYPEILEGKQFVVWEFVERDIRLGRNAWLEVPLPDPLYSGLPTSQQARAGKTKGNLGLEPAVRR